MRTAASIKSLMQIKDVTEEDAKAIRAIWHASWRGGENNKVTARERIDAILRTCGVEWLGVHKRLGKAVYYCNAGDTYATTVIFIGGRLVVGCWGDLVERNMVREAYQNEAYYGLID